MLLGPTHKEHLEREDRVTVTENISEWEYGNAERLKPLEIKESGANRGLLKWDIWRMGCEVRE